MAPLRRAFPPRLAAARASPAGWEDRWVSSTKKGAEAGAFKVHASGKKKKEKKKKEKNKK